jgi:hypothetical protein
MVKRYMVKGFNSYLPIYEEDELTVKGMISTHSGKFMHAEGEIDKYGFNNKDMHAEGEFEFVLTSQCNCKSCSKSVIIGSDVIVTNAGNKKQALYCSIKCVRKNNQPLNKKK